MKTISEHNSQSRQQMVQEHKAGVLCDDCKVEMFYPNAHAVLACYPPRKTVQCPKCNKIEYKLC